MRRDGMIVDPMTPEQFAAFIDKETKVWAPVMQAAGLTAREGLKCRRTTIDKGSDMTNYQQT